VVALGVVAQAAPLPVANEMIVNKEFRQMKALVDQQ